MKEKQQMKKLMIATACAAVGLGAFAVATPEVYNMQITLKTMTCKAAEGKNICEDEYSTFRVKATTKIEGLIWGCDCPTIAQPEVFETFDKMGTDNACHGYTFWNSKAKSPYETPVFVWSDAAGEFEDFLFCIDPKCSQVEGLWQLQLSGKVLTDCEDPKSGDVRVCVSLQGAGVGSCKWNSDHLAAYIQSMSGNVTGWAFPGFLEYGCKACGGGSAGCSAWRFCTACDEIDCTIPSTAYGTWTLKFNTSASKKYGKADYYDETTKTGAILAAYNFPTAVKNYLIEVHEGGVTPERTPAEKAYDAAKAEYQTAVRATQLAQQGLVNLQGERVILTNAQATAEYAMKHPETTTVWSNGLKQVIADQTAFNTAEQDLTKLIYNSEAMKPIREDAAVMSAYVDSREATEEFLVRDAYVATGYANAAATNFWKEAKATMVDKKLVLSNAMAKNPASQATKDLAYAGIEEFENAAKTYVDDAYLTCQCPAQQFGFLQEFDWQKDWAKTGNPSDTIIAGLKEINEAAKAKVAAKDKEIAAAQTKVDEAKANEAEKKDRMETAKIICDATGGDCN